MSPTVFVFILAGLLILATMILSWLISLALRNSSIVDISWGLMFVLAAWLDFALSPFMSPAKWLMLILVNVWGLRLAMYVFIRNRRKGEDFRYARWRAENGARWWWVSLFQVFLLQGFIAWIIAAPVLASALRTASRLFHGWVSSARSAGQLAFTLKQSATGS